MCKRAIVFVLFELALKLHVHVLREKFQGEVLQRTSYSSLVFLRLSIGLLSLAARRKVQKLARTLLNLFFHFHCFFHWGALGNAPCYYAKLCGGRIRPARECVSAFSTFPDPNALSSDSRKSALWACVRFLHLRDHFYVAFSNCGSVTGSQSACGPHFFCSPHPSSPSQFFANFFSPFLSYFCGFQYLLRGEISAASLLYRTYIAFIVNSH
jgi:hypothetical protein